MTAEVGGEAEDATVRAIGGDEARYRALFQNMDAGFCVIEMIFDDAGAPADYRFIEANAAFERQAGFAVRSGVRMREIVPDHEQHWFDVYGRVATTGEPARLVEGSAPLGRWWDVHAFRVEDPARRRVAVMFQDISERRLAESRLKETSERIQLALDAGAIVGTWLWDVPADRFTADERFAEYFDLDPEECNAGLPLERVTSSIHPEDQARVAVAITEALGRGGPYRARYRVRQRGGAFGWVEASGRVDVDDQGTPMRFPGVLLDIGAQLALEAERDRAVTLLRSFVEAVPGVVYAKDIDGRFLMANRGTSELLGMAPELYLGRTDLEVLQDQDEAARIMRTDRRIMTTGQQEQVEEDVRLADGAPAIWLSTKAPLRDADGAVIGLIGSSVDITERRRAEERERMLAQEVDHRGKNLLAVVQSVVQLTRADTIEDFVATVGGRIAALSRTHSLLAESRWKGAELATIIREELAPFTGARTERVAIDGAPLQLRPEAAQTLALVVHELATNAAKYGALSTEDGQLRVHWRIDAGASQGDQLNALWVETGGPSVTAPTRRGFGSTIIKTGVERQLRGRLLKTWRPEGLLCEVSVPIDELVVA